MAWDTNDDLIEQQKEYEKLLQTHYGVTDDTPSPTHLENSTTENRVPYIPSPSNDQNIDKGKVANEEEENFDERAPFIPLSIMDSELDCDDDLLVEIPFLDSPMIPSPSSWLLNADESIPSPGSAVMLPPAKPLSCYHRPSLSNSCSPVLSRKEIPTAIKRNGYVTNEMAHKGKALFPNISTWEAEVNAPVQNINLLQGDDLLEALECVDFL